MIELNDADVEYIYVSKLYADQRELFKEVTRYNADEKESLYELRNRIKTACDENLLRHFTAVSVLYFNI